jgi:hypothetical protein
MKKIFLLILLFAGIKSFGQEVVTEEKSSAWLKIAAPVASKPAAKKKTTTAKTATKKTSTPPKTTSPAVVPKKDDEFNKTNSKVKRFQKS